MVTNKRETSYGRMRDIANLLWLEIAEATYNFRRVEREIGVVESTTLENVADFYRDKISADAPDRRLVVISIGPDAILNRLDDADASLRHWTIDEVEEFRQSSTSLRRRRLPVDRMDSWFQGRRCKTLLLQIWCPFEMRSKFWFRLLVGTNVA